jgi:hypothetical protein
MSLWKRVVLSTLLVLCAAIALAPSAGPSKRIPNGVRIAGVNVSGLDAGQAKQQIGARFATPVRFKFAREHWAVSPEMLGMNAEVGDAVSRAKEARSGDDIGVSVDVNRDAVKEYVSSLDERFGIPAENAVVVGLVDGHPKIADSQWGRTVRRQTMVRGIVRMLRTRIRPELPVVMETLKPSVEKSGFGPVVVINRGANSLQLFSGEQPVRSFHVATGRSQYPTRPARSASSICRRIPGGVHRIRPGRRGSSRSRRARATRLAHAGWGCRRPAWASTARLMLSRSAIPHHTGAYACSSPKRPGCSTTCNSGRRS